MEQIINNSSILPVDRPKMIYFKLFFMTKYMLDAKFIFIDRACEVNGQSKILLVQW